MPADDNRSDAITVLSGRPPILHRKLFAPVDRAALLLQALPFLPEGEHADVRSLIEAGEWAEAAHQMRGGPGYRAIPAVAHALIDRAMA